MEAGRATATARKVKQEPLFKELQAAKESLQMSEATSSADPEQSEDVSRASKKHVMQKEESWAPWINGASSLVVVFLFQHFKHRSRMLKLCGRQVHKINELFQRPQMLNN